MSEGISSSAVDETWDVVVIGSGMGGLSAASALSRTGHKVLVLEQYDHIGGLTGSFCREGFSWDVGVHYLSFLAPGEPARQILDWLSDKPIKLKSMGAVYDVLHIGDAEPLPLSRPFDAQILDLKERYPADTSAIDAWFDAIHHGYQAANSVFRSRAIPQPVGSFMGWWKRSEIERWCGRTAAEVAAEMTDNPELLAAFLAQWGDHGGLPSKASFAAHALVAYSYLHCGAWYPEGGASTIAEHILPVIRNAGGEVRGGVPVESLIVDEGRVVGVKTAEGQTIRSGAVVSSIGVRETVDRLLPAGVGEDAWIEEIRSLSSGICHFSLYLGFHGDIEAHGATKANHWIFPDGNVDAAWSDVPDGRPPAVFISFPSVKDPAHRPGPERRQTGEVCVFAEWPAVARWADMPQAERGASYAAFKQQVEARLLEQFEAAFPELAPMVVYRELSTPLSAAAITGHIEGSVYGRDVTPERMLTDALRMKSPVDGLYLAGQDVVSPGVPGAMWGGVLCAGNIDARVFRKIL